MSPAIHSRTVAVAAGLEVAAAACVVVLDVLRFASGTLWAAVLAHGFINSIGFVAFYLAGPVDAFW